MSETMKYEEWYAAYVAPFEQIANGGEAIDPIEDGFDGYVLEGILATKDIDGQEITDWECVEEIQKLIEITSRIREQFYEQLE
jgi:hypothetical protein